MNLLELMSASNAPTPGALAAFLLRVTALAAAGHLALFALRHASAAARHLAATVTLAALILAPIAFTLVPVRLAVPLPFRAAAAWRAAVTGSMGVPVPRLAGAPVPGTPASRVPALDRSPARSSATPIVPALSEEGGIATSAPDARWPAPSWPGAASLLALAGALLLLAMRAVGSLRASWLAARATDCDDDGLLLEVARAGRLVDLRRPVAVRTSDRLQVPVVVGPFRPTLLLPGTFASWPAARRRAVLLHELAHVARRDGVALLVSRVATALYWFHPLAWTLARVARHECERACDDVVLRAGIPATDYADDLLAIARAALSGSFPGASLAFVRRSSLEGRLIAILAPGARRTPATHRAVALALGAALLVLLPLTALRVAAAPPPRPAKVKPAEVAADRGETELLASRVTPNESRGASKENPLERSSNRRVTDPAMHLPPADSKSGAEWYSAAKGYYDDERWGPAGEAYENAANAGFRTGTAWYNAACSYSLDGQKNRALGALGKALDEGFGGDGIVQSDSDLDPLRNDRRFDLMVRGAQESQMDEKKDESRASSRALLATNSNDPSALRTAGIALMRGGDPKHAAEAFAREYAVDSASTSIYNQACALALAHETAPALAALRRSIYAGYGDSEKFRSDDDLASLRGEAEFRTLSDLADDLSLQIYMTDGFGDSRWRKQMPRLEQAAREHADAGRAWWNLGFGQLRMGDPESSLDSFGRALDRGYRASNTLYNMACASAQRHDPDAALGYLARAEKAGMEVGKVALDDHDLDPIRSDSRFRAMADRWRDERRDETMNKFIGKSKDKDRK